MTPATSLAAFLGTAGALHLVVPAPFDTAVPPELPGSARTWTLASGVVEMACAALVAAPQTRRAGGLACAALFVGVFPGNVHHARRARTPAMKALCYARLPLQVPLVLWALRVRREA